MSALNMKSKTLALVSIVAIVSVCTLLNGYAINRDGMWRDFGLTRVLSEKQISELEQARPLNSGISFYPNGHPAYTEDFAHVPVASIKVAVKCKTENGICGSALKQYSFDQKSGKKEGAISFSVVNGMLIAYSTGDVRNNVELYRDDIRKLVDMQIELWRDKDRLASLGDSL